MFVIFSCPNGHDLRLVDLYFLFETENVNIEIPNFLPEIIFHNIVHARTGSSFFPARGATRCPQS